MSVPWCPAVLGRPIPTGLTALRGSVPRRRAALRVRLTETGFGGLLLGLVSGDGDTPAGDVIADRAEAGDGVTRTVTSPVIGGDGSG
ncbi:hypothetical protein GCM10023194_64460 [Planotetraspora phitsanulokensis]|uniref:Uncharacterized protein n=1 Tax=Planotetraspora phitsanulokensis TaxID=575192 RepID=A0A8J3XJG1_9ACTN|nr:hypothetical protein Pph01_35260 [Planotetraspora phitsanulokensis]